MRSCVERLHKTYVLKLVFGLMLETGSEIAIYPFLFHEPPLNELLNILERFTSANKSDSISF